MCQILNTRKIKRFQKLVYCLPLDIVNYTLSSHEGNFLHPKTKKPFQVEDYQDYLPFLDKKKLVSHLFIFVPICYAQHWWLWIVDVEKKEFYVIDPINKKAPTKERTTINKFFGFVISKMRVFIGGEPLIDKDEDVEAPYINISGHYGCAIYVMKWLDVEYATILLDKINQLRDKAIEECEAIRLSKSSAALLSPYCTLKSLDIDSR
ncbi:hypothetical protein Ahy_A06g026611 [Arachis hypogaea]|uniref:Ubiquitin-like protease family profile domain-containing protein n=1 Tax=Arachis hypogaea TaxID=3818 RepID=A0A445CL56_ARAHY|nr:hypothetical protein Ahy_A06g026611 [Arachis hypogaea]